MTKWEINQEKTKTQKCKKWLHACGRPADFNMQKVTKDTYICSLHFVGNQGPTEENPDPIIAKLSHDVSMTIERRRKPPKKRIVSTTITSAKKQKLTA